VDEEPVHNMAPLDSGRVFLDLGLMVEEHSELSTTALEHGADGMRGCIVEYQMETRRNLDAHKDWGKSVFSKRSYWEECVAAGEYIGRECTSKRV